MGGFFVFWIFWTLMIAFLIFRRISKTLRLQKLVRGLSATTNDETVSGFIDYLKTQKRVPNLPTIWDTMRASYEIVATSETVDVKLKKELRMVLLGLGVNRLKEIRQ